MARWGILYSVSVNDLDIVVNFLVTLCIVSSLSTLLEEYRLIGAPI